jgi:small nuclear ribonucleoprotein
MTKKRPLDILNASLNKRVIVHLRGKREYRGTLDGYDHPHLNLVLKGVDEIHNVGTEQETTTKREMVIVRGDNIIYISP